MGGLGSGRIGEKTLTSQMVELNVRFFHRQGFFRKVAQLKPNMQIEARDESGRIHIRVTAQQLSIDYIYTGYSGECDSVSMIVKFDWTPCHFGGRRPWFLCPKCGRRVAILYGGKYFNCRICRNLAYPSENESKASRLLRKANKIRKILDTEPGVLNQIMFKPKGMHQETFDRLVREVYALEDMAAQQLSQKLKRNHDLQH